MKVIQRKGRSCYLLRWRDRSGKWKEETTEVPAVSSKRAKAERAAADKEKEIEGFTPETMLWSAFVERYHTEHLSLQSDSYQTQFACANSRLQGAVSVNLLSDVTASTLSTFAAKVRAAKKPLKEASIASYLKAILAALKWAEDHGLIAKTPKVKLPSGASAMRSRPISAEELDRYILAAKKVRPDDYQRWRRAIRWLYYSGLRVSEAVRLSWDRDKLFTVHLTEKEAWFVISKMGQKSRRDEICPMAPDFAAMLRRVPEKSRKGNVFRLPFTVKWVTKVLGKIGRRSRIKVNDAGKMVSAHDLRRSFCTRWSLMVQPVVLQKLARHNSIETTLKYYVLHDAKTLHDKLVEAMGEKKGVIAPLSTKAQVAKERASRDDD